MARQMGDNVDFSLNGVSIETSLNSVAISFTNAPGEITSFTDPYGNFLASGKKNTTTEISGSYDAAAAGADQTIFEAIGNGPVTTLFDVDGAGPASDSPVFTCTASGLAGVLVSAYSFDFPVGGPGTYSATLQHSGATTRATS